MMGLEEPLRPLVPNALQQLGGVDQIGEENRDGRVQGVGTLRQRVVRTVLTPAPSPATMKKREKLGATSTRLAHRRGTPTGALRHRGFRAGTVPLFEARLGKMISYQNEDHRFDEGTVRLSVRDPKARRHRARTAVRDRANRTRPVPDGGT